MIPILYVGPPGIGKTAKVLAEFDHVEILLLSACTEEDIAGIPYLLDPAPGSDRRGEGRTMPAFIQRLREHAAKYSTARRCLFLDEMDKARREVVDTLLSLVQSPALFGLPLDCAIVSAANPPAWGGGDGISPAMASRFAIVDAVPDPVAWATWARSVYAEHPAILRHIDMTVSRESPILEHTGDYAEDVYSARLTCPRTIERAWQACIAGREDLVSGLVTANAATAIIACFAQPAPGEAEARTVGAKAWTRPAPPRKAPPSPRLKP